MATKTQKKLVGLGMEEANVSHEKSGASYGQIKFFRGRKVF